jgi:GTPase SAR1 family protein
MDKAPVRETLTVPNVPIANARSGSGSGSSVATAESPRSPSSPRPCRRKLVVVGDGAAGKTSLLVAYRDRTFSSDYVPTVFENSLVSVPVEHKTVDLALWDTAGMPRCSLLASMLTGTNRTGRL